MPKWKEILYLAIIALTALTNVSGDIGPLLDYECASDANSDDTISVQCDDIKNGGAMIATILEMDSIENMNIALYDGNNVKPNIFGELFAGIQALAAVLGGRMECENVDRDTRITELSISIQMFRDKMNEMIRIMKEHAKDSMEFYERNVLNNVEQFEDALKSFMDHLRTNNEDRIIGLQEHDHSAYFQAANLTHIIKYPLENANVLMELYRNETLYDRRKQGGMMFFMYLHLIRVLQLRQFFVGAKCGSTYHIRERNSFEYYMNEMAAMFREAESDLNNNFFTKVVEISIVRPLMDEYRKGYNSDLAKEIYRQFKEKFYWRKFVVLVYDNLGYGHEKHTYSGPNSRMVLVFHYQFKNCAVLMGSEDVDIARDYPDFDPNEAWEKIEAQLTDDIDDSLGIIPNLARAEGFYPTPVKLVFAVRTFRNLLIGSADPNLYISYEEKDNIVSLHHISYRCTPWYSCFTWRTITAKAGFLY